MKCRWGVVLLAMCVVLAGCAGGGTPSSQVSGGDVSGSGETQIENPIEPAGSLEKLCELVGFEVVPPQLPFEPLVTEYISIGGETAEIRFTGENGVLCCRVCPGESEESISGVYQSFEVIGSVETPSGTADILGREGLAFLCEYYDGSYNYSLSAETGWEPEEFAEIARGFITSAEE